MVSFSLTAADADVRELAREFTEEELLPADPTAIDQISDPYDRFPWELIEQASEYGLRELGVPERYGGPDASTVSLTLAAEELGYGDPGITTTISQCWRVARMIEKLGTDEQCDRFFDEFISDDRYVPAIAMTEVQHGSNNALPYDGNNLDTTADLDGDEWVINGTKRFITNGPFAKTIVLFANTDEGKGRSEGVSMFLVPSDAPGLSVGTVHSKIGERLKVNSELVFSDCRIPKENLLGERDRAFPQMEIVGGAGKLYAAARFLGVSKRAYHEARRHAEKRVQGGKPIVEHQMVKERLADMTIQIESARSLFYRTAWMVDQGDERQADFIDISKISSAECVREVCNTARSILGGEGVMKSSPMEKHVRDAANADHAEGHEMILKLRVGSTADEEFVD